MRAILPLLLLLAGCSARYPDSWRVADGDRAEADEVARVVHQIAGDRFGFGGKIVIVEEPPLSTLPCAAWRDEPGRMSGCVDYRIPASPVVYVVRAPTRGLGPSLWRTALPHELCHVALASTDEGRVEQCAQRAIQAHANEELAR